MIESVSINGVSVLRSIFVLYFAFCVRLYFWGLHGVVREVCMGDAVARKMMSALKVDLPGSTGPEGGGGGAAALSAPR